MTNDRKLKIGVVAGLAVALAVAVGASGAIAVSRALDPREESQAVIEDAAEELGVEPTALSDALRNALENRVDEAVEAGRLTEEQGARLRERIESGAVPLIGGLGHRGLGKAGGRLGKFDAAATYLGLSDAELRDALRDGKTLAEIAREQGKSVDGLVSALVEEARATLDEAVAAGKLTEERAAELEANLEERMTDLVNGELRRERFGHRFGHGPGFFDGPPAFRGSRA